MIPYGRQIIDEEDISSVCDVLRSDYLTTGPKVGEFEQEVARYVGVEHAVAVSNGTAALHCVMSAFGIGPGDEVIVPAMTFASTANCVLFQGGTPVFVDVEPDTLLIAPEQVEKKITQKTKAIIGVDYAGQPCDWDALREIADKKNLKLVADSCHALGSEYKGKMTGTIADATVFSFHPVKHITSGEGGMVVTRDADMAKRMRVFRTHGITSDVTQRQKTGTWFYEMQFLGYNYRISDILCALGISQIKKLPAWIQKRQEVALKYDAAFHEIHGLTPLSVRSDVQNGSRTGNNGHVYHLYVIQFDVTIGLDRNKIYKTMRSLGIGVNVHYIPVHLHPYYKKRFGTKNGMCPVAENAYERILSLPMWPGLSDENQDYIIRSLITSIKREISDG